MTRTTWLAAATLLAGPAIAAIDPIVIKGSKFFYQNSGAQFFIKGVAYGSDYTGVGAVAGADASGGFNDPLADPSGCERDIPYLKELETNTIRVYAIDTSLNHDSCMNALANAGIYVLADLSAPAAADSIDRTDPEWTDDLYTRYASVIDLMSQYENTLGFFAGNEVANAPNTTSSAPFVKAAVRDMKAYIKQQGYRTIGVGYATNDNTYIRELLADFFNCGDQTDAISFWGYNIYEWCGVSGYVQSGYAARTQEFSSYSVPVFFAEYGCNTYQPRIFDEVAALYGSNMSPVFSGGIVYEYFQASNDYGLVTLGSNSQVTTLTDFNNYKTQIAKVSPQSTSINDYNPTNQPQACPTSQQYFRAQATPLPPTPNEELCSCMYDVLECVVKPGTSVQSYGNDFKYICGKEPAACKGFAHDSETGTYGAYSMCNATQQLAWAFNAYYLINGRASTACDFNGNAQRVSASSPNSACASLLGQAGGQGTGTVTSSPQGTGAGAAGGSGSGSGSSGGSSSSGGGSGASASSSKGAAASFTPRGESGLLQLVCFVALAVISGSAIILL